MPPTTRSSAASSRTSTRSRTGSGQQQTLNFRSAGKISKPAVNVLPGKKQENLSVLIPVKKEKGKEKEKEKEKEEEKVKAKVLMHEKAAEDVEEEESEEEEEEPGAQLALSAPPVVELEKEEKNEDENEDDDEAPLTILTAGTTETPLSLPPLTPSSLSDLPQDLLTTLSKLTSSSITTFYKTRILPSRTTKAIHQSHLSTHEKILRHFDLTSQYGPSIGITRLNRWKRAWRLGMNPPVEVLAVLMEVEKKGGKPEEPGKRDERTAILDEELSTRTARE